MKRVVDSSTYSSPEFRQYLSASKGNVAVLIDYVAMEAYKARDFGLIYRAAEVVAEFPDQVIVLKSTKTICALSGRTAGLTRRMIDEAQTKELRKYCQGVAAAKRGGNEILMQLEQKRQDALAHLDRMLHDAPELSSAMSMIAETFTEAELLSIKNETPYSQEMLTKVTKSILELTVFLHQRHPSVQRMPTVDEVRNTFLFRAAVCAYALAIDWARVGGSSMAKPEKIRNDAVDVSFSAYATYFDGLLSNDQKQQRIYLMAQEIMASLFRLKTPGA